MHNKTKNLKEINKKNKKFSIWKTALITIGSVVGLIGIIFLIIFLTDGFNNSPKNPYDIYFADVIIAEDGTKTYIQRGTNPYNVGKNFDLVVSTSTEEFNQTGLELSFPRSQSKYYLIEIDLSEEVSELSKVFYSIDSKGNKIKFASCGEGQATHVTNGIIVVPRYVSINTTFTASLVLATDDLNGAVTDET